jgi:carbon storage regulator
MLVLSRKSGESVHIDGGIKVTVVKLHAGKIQLGIEAPESVSIVRAELNDWSGLSFDDSASDQSQEVDVIGEHCMNIGSGI